MEDNEFTNFKCTVPNCNYALDGKCIDGLNPPLICKNRSQVSGIAIADTGTTVEKVVSTKLYFPRGRALTQDGTEKLMAGSPVTLILLAGLKDSGKSTMLGSLMQLFQDNDSFGSCRFSGSETLVSFEEICHLSRMRSERSKPHTIRTPRGQEEILHLRVKPIEKDLKKVDLLMTNLSGEDFEDLSNNTKAASQFYIAKRADHFTLFIDSNNLSDLEARQATKINSINVLLGLLDAGMLGSETKIEIVFSRWDMLLKKDDLDSHKSFIQSIRQEFVRRLEKFNMNTEFFELASRPTNNETLNFGHGIDSLFKRWVFNNDNSSVSFQDKTSVSPVRPFSKF